MTVTIERQGQRVYLVGDTYAIKDRIKAIGGHWDSYRRAWWVGSAKASEAKALTSDIANEPATPPAKQDPSDIYLTGKGRYKGREYFVGSTTRDGNKVRLLTLPDADNNYLDFWVVCSEVEQTKTYSPREYRGRMQYTTLGGIARFIAREQSNREAGGEVCQECGKSSGELVTDLEDGGRKHRYCCGKRLASN